MIRIQNIFYMLCYAFKALRGQGYRDMDVESFNNVSDLCAEILIKGTSVQIKQGLNHEYISNKDTLSSPKGKINISESIKTRSIINHKLSCSYDEFSINSYLNRVLKTTLLILIQSDIKKENKKRIRKLLVYFQNVDTP